MSILKDLIQEIKIQATNWEKIFAKFIFDTGVGHKIDRDLLNNPVNNKQRSEQTTQPKKVIQRVQNRNTLNIIHHTPLGNYKLKSQPITLHILGLLNSKYMTIPIAGG